MRLTSRSPSRRRLRDLLPQRIELREVPVLFHVRPEGPPVHLAAGDRLARAGGGGEGLLMAFHENRAVRVHRGQVLLPLEGDPEFVRHPLPEGQERRLPLPWLALLLLGGGAPPARPLAW